MQREEVAQIPKYASRLTSKFIENTHGLKLMLSEGGSKATNFENHHFSCFQIENCTLIVCGLDMSDFFMKFERRSILLFRPRTNSTQTPKNGAMPVPCLNSHFGS